MIRAPGATGPAPRVPVEPAVRVPRGAGGSGGAQPAPARLDTPGGTLPAAGTMPEGGPPERSPRHAARPAPRARTARARPVSQSREGWIRAVAGALRALGEPGKARSLGECGRTAVVRRCRDCGEIAEATIRATCGLRACPWCERIAARERAERVTAAALRAADLAHARAATVRARMEAEAAERALARDHWRALELAARERYAARGRTRDAERAEGHAARAERAEGARRRARRMASQCAQVRSWRWRLITVSPAWDPRSARACEVDGLRARLADLRARVDALWDHVLSAGGAAAATVRVEISSRGHVHAHVLHYGPHVPARHARDVAGCHVDVRAIAPREGADPVEGLRAAVREATKYATKSVSPTRGEWIAGERWRVIHPDLAAAWVVATDGAQLVTHRGLMRDALAAAEACDPPAPPEHDTAALSRCRWCGGDVPCSGDVISVRDLALALGARAPGAMARAAASMRWRAVVRLVRCRL